MLEQVVFIYGIGAIVPLLLLATLRWFTDLRDLVKPLVGETTGNSLTAGRSFEWATGREVTAGVVKSFLDKIEKGKDDLHYVGLLCECPMAESYLVARIVKSHHWIKGGEGFVGGCRRMVKNAAVAGMAYAFGLVYFLAYIYGEVEPSFIVSAQAWSVVCGLFLLASVLLAIVTAGPLTANFGINQAQRIIE